MKASKIKICGLFKEQDIEFVNEAKPDFIGFVFAENSKRFIDSKKAESLRKNLSEEIISVGVFVNAKINNIISLYKNGIIKTVQLHGAESDEYVKELKSLIDAKIIRINKSNHYGTPKLQSSLSDYILLDSQIPGSGKVFNWENLKGIDLSENVFLAGGINLDNIETALSFNPFAIDVSSGAETNGVKDREKILKLVSICRASKHIP